MNCSPLALAALAALALAGAPTPAAAETVTCTTITSLPATLATQGVYCLKTDLATTLDTGNAITIAVNNVTIDCNGFKLGGLGAGPGTYANGIRAQARNNVVVRNCNVRGFAYGINLDGAGHVVEGNRLDGNTRVGIVVFGDGSLVSDNRVLDSGGAIGTPLQSTAIYTFETVDIIGNTIDGVHDAVGGGAVGIYTLGNHGGAIDRNRVRGLTSSTNFVWAVLNSNPFRISIRDNQLVGVEGIGVGVSCPDDGSVFSGNLIFGFNDYYISCRDGGGNLFK
jgi:parallel beta-helix repeat protein